MNYDREGNRVSKYIMHLAPGVKTVDIYAKLLQGYTTKTFEVLVLENNLASAINSYM